MRIRGMISRRQAVGGIGAALLAGSARAAEEDVTVQITPVSPHAARLSVLPVKDGKAVAVVGDGTLVREDWGAPARTVKIGNETVQVTRDPLAFTIGKVAIRIDRATGAVSFTTGGAPILAMGEGGPQFDRRGNIDRMLSGSSGYNLRT